MQVPTEHKHMKKYFNIMRDYADFINAIMQTVFFLNLLWA